MSKYNIQSGTTLAPKKFRITISPKGPYLVYGKPPMARQYLLTQANHEVYSYKQGEEFVIETEPVALCRCGGSGKKPFCDGTHTNLDWSPELTAPNTPILDGANTYHGTRVSLTDNESYCARARFCLAKGEVWSLIEKDDDVSTQLAIEESNLCPAGRLSVWDNSSGEPLEPHFDPSIGLIEDPDLGVSGGIWVRGGIPITTESGEIFEVRNRVTLCRCGKSAFKPFCDGTHCDAKFRDSPYE